MLLMRSQIQKEIRPRFWKQSRLRMISLDEVPRNYMVETGDTVRKSRQSALLLLKMETQKSYLFHLFINFNICVFFLSSGTNIHLFVYLFYSMCFVFRWENEEKGNLLLKIPLFSFFSLPPDSWINISLLSPQKGTTVIQI